MPRKPPLCSLCLRPQREVGNRLFCGCQMHHEARVVGKVKMGFDIPPLRRPDPEELRELEEALGLADGENPGT